MVRSPSWRRSTWPRPGAPIRRRSPISSRGRSGRRRRASDMSSLDGAPPSSAEAPGGGRRFRAASPPREATSWATTAVLVALLLIVTSWVTLNGVRSALAELKIGSVYTDILLAIVGVGVCILALPALRSLKAARDGRAALAAGDIIAARVAAAASRDL